MMMMMMMMMMMLDYGNFMFVGLPAYLQRRLQAVLNAAARLVFRIPTSSLRPRH